MQKQEFEKLIGNTVTDPEYEVIETVYQWHPSIRNTSGKEEVAELYKSFGIAVFYDMLPRAEKFCELENMLLSKRLEMDRIKEQIEELSCVPFGKISN